MMLLKGKTALITGASKGIGTAIARVFAANGANLILLARNIEELQRIEREIKMEYADTSIAVFNVDVSNEDAVKSCFKSIAESKLPIQIVVNNAGVMLDAPLMMLKSDILRKNMDVNLLGSFYVAQSALKFLIRNKGGAIINISSIVASKGSAGQSAYAASKSGLIGMTLSLSKELAPLNIRVNVISPGFIQTGLIDNVPENAREKVLSNIGMKRIGTPEDVAKVALFLASDMSDYVTGQIIGVDGGMII